uniref:NADH-ubiquinone oxidoreductase chain 6 n=1 Tax=Metanephrops sibogae TaxID=490595 RepID=A0A090MJX1_9EUCA|nr:NADH dehydrogenase subunit 6 [Metanephrops sibogae]CEG06199.1 NADH dehydrogenase subunit 6 [Metanephrops sibogae]
MKLLSEILFFMLPMVLATSFLFVRLLHPLAMGLCLVAQTVMISITAGLNNSSFWFSYILFLIFLGAMLVLFIYVASLASNEPFKFSSLTLVAFVSFMMLGLCLALIKDPLYITPDINILSSSLSPTLFLPNLTQSLISTIYSSPTTPFTLFMVLYLLLTLVVVVKIMTMYSSPLRLSSS